MKTPRSFIIQLHILHLDKQLDKLCFSTCHTYKHCFECLLYKCKLMLCEKMKYLNWNTFYKILTKFNKTTFTYIYVYIYISGIILGMHPANERRRYIVTSSLNGWTHTQNTPLYILLVLLWSWKHYTSLRFVLEVHLTIGNHCYGQWLGNA